MRKPTLRNSYQTRGPVPNDAMIQCQNHTNGFGDIVATDHASFPLESRFIHRSPGLNGSVKTRVIHLLRGIFQSSCGRAQIAGVDVVHEADRINGVIGHVLQKCSRHGELTVDIALLLFGEPRGMRGKPLPSNTNRVGTRANPPVEQQTLGGTGGCRARGQR